MRYEINDRVKLVKENDRNFDKHGYIKDVIHAVHAPITYYDIIFDDGRKGTYFFIDIIHE